MSYPIKGRFNGRRITEMIRLFYKRMIQLNKLRACFDQSFFKTRSFFLLVYQGY